MKPLAFLSLAVLTINVNGAARPNIILFVTDDQVKEELACYGGKVLTPHIDRLAREGMRYDNAYVRPPFALLLATRC